MATNLVEAYPSFFIPFTSWTLALNLEDFLSRKLRFIEDFEDHIKSPQVTCQVADYTSVSLLFFMICIFGCMWSNSPLKSTFTIKQVGLSSVMKF